jgi:GNAT superfamily N-acetyltransferase
MKNHVSIESASPQHLPKLVQLFEAYRSSSGQPSNRMRAVEFLSARIRNQDSHIFLAIYRNNPIGFAQCYPLFSSKKMQRIWLLNDLYIDPVYRRKGVAQQLLSACKDMARQTESAGLILETETHNSAANQLCTNSGFSLDRVHNYYLWSTHKTH